MKNENEKVSNGNLEKVSGGFSGVQNSCSSPSCLDVTQEEYDCLVDGGYIIDGKCDWHKLEEAANYLNKKGYTGRIFHTGERLPGEKLCTDVKITINKKIPNKSLEKVSGGFGDLLGCRPQNISTVLNKEEYKFLVDKGYIVDKKLVTSPKSALYALIKAGYKLEDEDVTK